MNAWFATGFCGCACHHCKVEYFCTPQNLNVYLSVRTDRFSVGEIIGRTVVIHSDPDDFHSQPAGNAGEKIACGVIQKI